MSGVRAVRSLPGPRARGGVVLAQFEASESAAGRDPSGSRYGRWPPVPAAVVGVRLRAFPCPNPLRRTAARRAQPVRDSYQCVPCLFGPSLPEPLAARAVLRSSIPLEEFACLANAGRVHLRIAESPWEGPA